MPELWPAALRSLADMVDAIGAGYIVVDKRTGYVDWAHLCGPTEGQTAEFVHYYSRLDPYLPLLGATPAKHWLRLSECLPKQALRRHEWYNDFILKCGVRDLLGTRLVDSPSRTVVIGIHQGTDQKSLDARQMARLRELCEPLAKAARLQYELAQRGWRFSLAAAALDRMAVGVIVADGDGCVIEMNAPAERIARSDDGLTIQQERVCAWRAEDQSRLGVSIDAAVAGKGPAQGQRMRIHRRSGRLAYSLTVAPLSPRLTPGGRPLAMLLFEDPEIPSVSETGLAEQFGLSPAECRLATALMTGKTLAAIATTADVQITTLRTQLSSVMRKVGVRRQADLLRVLSAARILGEASDGG